MASLMDSPSGCQCCRTTTRYHPILCRLSYSLRSLCIRVRMVVFYLFSRRSCIRIHTAPTALAYTVSLMSTSLSRVECRKHLLLFSASTPVGAITSYASFFFFGLKKVDGVGTALLISVGLFDCSALSTRNDPVSGWELPLRCNRIAARLPRSLVNGSGEHENASISPCIGDLYSVYAGYFTRPWAQSQCNPRPTVIWSFHNFLGHLFFVCVFLVITLLGRVHGQSSVEYCSYVWIRCLRSTKAFCYRVSQRRYRSSAKVLAPVVTYMRDKL